MIGVKTFILSMYNFFSLFSIFGMGCIYIGTTIFVIYTVQSIYSEKLLF